MGTDFQAFHIHKDLLAGLSDELRNYVYNDTKEGQESSMEMGQVSPDTMRRFMEFCYSGDYLYTSGAENDSGDLPKDKDATEAFPLLLTHAKLYVFADMFDIVSLKELFRSKLIAPLSSVPNRPGARWGPPRALDGMGWLSIVRPVLTFPGVVRPGTPKNTDCEP